MTAVFKCEVHSGQELIETVTKLAEQQGVHNGAIVALIGAVDRCSVSNMPVDDARVDVITEYDEPFELSGTGEIVDGRVHIHCVLSGEGDRAIAGHLHSAEIETWYVAAYVIPSLAEVTWP